MSSLDVMRTEYDARRHLTQIRLTAGIVRENLPKLYELVQEAKACGDDQILGYPSWTAYVSDVFSGEPMRLPREERQQLVSMLAGEGMSTRAIAPIVGVHRDTVAEDLRGGGFPPPAREHYETIQRDMSGVVNDHTSRPAPAPASEQSWSPETGFNVHPFTGEIVEPPVVTTETHSIKVVTGLDGKQYPARPNPIVTALLEDDAAGIDRKYVIAFLGEMRNAQSFVKFDAARLARLDPDALLVMRGLQKSVDSFVAEMESNQGLRLVVGESK
jgi:hypothetical protein